MDRKFNDLNWQKVQEYVDDLLDNVYAGCTPEEGSKLKHNEAIFGALLILHLNEKIDLRDMIPGAKAQTNPPSGE